MQMQFNHFIIQCSNKSLVEDALVYVFLDDGDEW